MGLLLVLILAISGRACGQETSGWEMRVCADPRALPASSQEQTGFENRVAGIIADELGADLSYVWTTSGPGAVQYHLHPGHCDLLMGVAEGTPGMINTVPYHVSPFVFLYRTDAGFSIDSLEDESLTELTIAVPPNGLFHKLLVDAGLSPNLVLIPTDRSTTGAERLTSIVQQLLDQKIDVTLAYGPEASYFVTRHPGELALSPISPVITSSGIPMYRISTIGLRPGDETFRDLLNSAIARRWDDIQAVLGEYGVPVLPIPQPVPPQSGGAPSVPIAAILPVPTSQPAITDRAAAAAQTGALMAYHLLGRQQVDSEPALRLLLASASSAEAATRAARRMVATEGAIALVGGIGSGQAEALAQVAEEENVLFFNVGSQSDALREARLRNTFHVEASASMYLNALAAWFAKSDLRRWFLVYESSPEGRAQHRRAAEAIKRVQGEQVGRAEVRPDQRVFYEVLEAIREEAPDVVLLLLTPENQELFLAQHSSEDLEAQVTGLLASYAQTRDFFFRVRQTAPVAGSGYRAVLWETTLEDSGAREMNEQFVSRSGQPMDSTGWATYAAIQIALEAILSTERSDASTLVEYLEDAEARFDVFKGNAVSFRRWDHQLRQPLYIVKISQEAQWGFQVQHRIALATLVGTVPSTDGDH